MPGSKKVPLEKIGYNVILANNGGKAVELVKTTNAIDLVLMDIMMPVMDGNEALIKIREIELSLGIIGSDEVKVIMISALDDAKTVVKAYSKGGATSYIVKPIEKDRLLHEMRSIGLPV